MLLIDTNIFLEILLEQGKKEICKKFLDDHIGELCMTDFTLQSIGVILSRYKKSDSFQKFVEDIMPNTQLITLPIEQYTFLMKNQREVGLDFDDTYQWSIAQYFGAQIVTMDKDFERVKDVNILFL